MNKQTKKETIKILIVDDEERMLRVLRMGLKNLGYDVRTANNGEEALNVLLTKSYHIILTDIKMPVMTGTELIYELWRLKIDIPVIVMTAYADVASAVKSLKYGAFDYIQKPFTIEELDRLFKEVLKNRKDEDVDLDLSLQKAVEQKEIELIRRALEKSKNVKSKAAKLLNVSERTLWYKIQRYKID